jgi:phenylalanyl-tRNA synthetase beta chain
MKISLNWLREYVDYGGTSAELAELLTMAGVEVEGVETRGLELEHVVVAQILAREPHPNADRLSVCRVDDGSGAPTPRQIVCGARNYKVGDKVPLALPGAVLPGDFRIKVGKLRGVESEGMLCSARELRLSEDGEGLLILDPDAPVGAPIGQLFPPDTILDLEITPNRSDLLSHFGLAREVSALSGSKLGAIPAALQQPSTGAALPVAIAEAAREACPFYTARVLENVQVAPSPAWLRQKLESVGLRPINNVVDVTNFVMLETGQPLHAFDAAAIGEDGIEARPAHEGEELLALDGRKYRLAARHLVIARGGGGRAEALAGVMGGEESGVNASTTRIILEAACFAAAGIRRTSRELGLSSDASYRFERGVDPAGIAAAADRAVALLMELTGCRQAGAPASAGTLAALEAPVRLRLSRCREVLGVDIAGEEVSRILQRFGLTVAGEHWTIPTFRPDLRREIDLIEEVSRVYGLGAIPPRTASTPAPISAADLTYDFLMGLRERLAGMGWQEARSVTLVRAASGGVALKNPLTEENAVLRGSLLPGLLAAAGRNARLGTADLRLFEIGRVFTPDTPKGAPEPVRAALLLTGARSPRGWRQGVGPESGDLYDLRAAIEQLAKPGLAELRTVEPEGEFSLAADLYLDGVKAGRVAQVAPAQAKALEVRAPVWVAEIDAAILQTAASRRAPFVLPPRFPSVTRDLAVVADRGVAHGSIAAALREGLEPLLTDVELFDVFTDDQGVKLPADRRSLAYSLTYRAEDRTLRAEEVNAAHARLKAALQRAFADLQFRE